MQNYSGKDEYLVLSAERSLDLSKSGNLKGSEDGLISVPKSKLLDTLKYVNNDNDLADIGVVKYEQKPILGVGPGRKADLSEPISLSKIIDNLKQHLGLPNVRLALATGKGKGKQNLDSFYKI